MGKSGNPARKSFKGTISWYSNSPAVPTGYGTQTAQVVSRLKRDGFDVAGLSNFGVEGLATEWDSGYGKVKVYQRGADLYSNDMIGVHHKHHRAKYPNQQDLLITLYDVWVLVAPSLNDLPVASWIPIDHNPVPPKVLEFAKKPNVTPIAMSRFGQRALEAAGVKAHYIPHAFEKVFKPTTHFEGVPVRDYTQWGNKFVVGMNAANKASGAVHRKAYGENFRAFADFAKDKDDVLLYVHTDWLGAYGGWNLSDLAVSCGIPKEKLLFCDPIEYRYGISSEKLAALYSGMDVLLSANYGEGFGIPQIEAQACGTPIITSASCASPELASPDSYIVSGQFLWDDPQKSWFHVPFIHDITAALEAAYQRGRKDFPETVAFASQFEAEKVYQTHWLPLLKELLPQ